MSWRLRHSTADLAKQRSIGTGLRRQRCKVFRKRFPGIKRYAELTSALLSSTGRPASSGPNQLSWSTSLLRQVTYPSPRGGLRCEWP